MGRRVAPLQPAAFIGTVRTELGAPSSSQGPPPGLRPSSAGHAAATGINHAALGPRPSGLFLPIRVHALSPASPALLESSRRGAEAPLAGKDEVSLKTKTRFHPKPFSKHITGRLRPPPSRPSRQGRQSAPLGRRRKPNPTARPSPSLTSLTLLRSSPVPPLFREIALAAGRGQSEIFRPRYRRSKNRQDIGHEQRQSRGQPAASDFAFRF